MRARHIVISIVALGAVWLPVFRDPPRDSFPLSTYPMFSSLLATESPVDLVVGLDGEGGEHRLSPELIAGTDEVIVAGSTVRQSVRSGTAEGLCPEVAERVAGSDRTHIVAVLVKTDRIDAVRWYSGDRTPVSTTVHAECAVVR